MMLVHLNESILMHGTCWFKLLVQVFWCKLISTCWFMLLVEVVWCRLIGTGRYKLLVHVDSDRLKVAVLDSMEVIGFLHLAFIF
jgi:hypothetical protein